MNIHVINMEKQLKIHSKLNGKKNNPLKGNKMSQKCQVV